MSKREALSASNCPLRSCSASNLAERSLSLAALSASYLLAAKPSPSAAAQGLITTGEARRRLDQAALDLARAEDLDLRNQPFERLNFALGVLQGVPYEQQNFGYRMGQSTQAGPSLFGQVLGGAGALASAYYAGRN